MLYRLNQLYNAVFAGVTPSEYSWLNTFLTTKVFTLFCQQTLPEQRHALDVYYDIRNNKTAIERIYGCSAYEDLLLAALLHDCGKSLIEPSLWQRILIVTTGYLPSRWKQRINSRRNFLSRTLMIYDQHPSWGRRLAAKAGINDNVQLLIQNHHSPHNPFEELLYLADCRH